MGAAVDEATRSVTAWGINADGNIVMQAGLRY